MPGFNLQCPRVIVAIFEQPGEGLRAMRDGYQVFWVEVLCQGGDDRSHHVRQAVLSATAIELALISSSWSTVRMYCAIADVGDTLTDVSPSRAHPFFRAK
jgi:hypothetical protein